MLNAVWRLPAERASPRDIARYLVDTFCLGVKNVIGPQRLRRRDLSSFIRTYFMAFPAPAIAVPVELAQHLVLGAVEYAARLGFSPHREFESARGHLGIPRGALCDELRPQRTAAVCRRSVRRPTRRDRGASETARH